MTIDISAIVTMHREGSLAVASLRSVRRATQYATSKGVKCEIILVLDKSDARTKKIACSFAEENDICTILETEYGDTGAARNRGVSKANGQYVAFLDGDDIWGESWLSRAIAAASSDPRPIVWHPEFNLYFGRSNHIFHHIDMEHPDFYMEGLAVTNYWTALCFVSRNVLLQNPYPPTSLDSKIGYEDWSWNMSVISQGFIHKIVPSSCHAIRVKKKSSLLATTNAVGCMPPPSNLFQKLKRRELPC